jgi:ABC-2 type transport system permease protein
MTAILVRKFLRDVRIPLIVVALLLLAFEALWCKITQRIAGELVPIIQLAPVRILDVLFEGPGQIIKTLIGGERINLGRAMDVLSIGYVHPLVQTLLCIWAIGRAAGAITGEIDRGTMELLLAQPVPRSRVVLAHLYVDLLVIPLLCASVWAGTLLGVSSVGQIKPSALPPQLAGRLPAQALTPEMLAVDPVACAPGLLPMAALLFAVSGYTLLVSALGRFRGRVLGIAVLVTLLQFLVNLLGQLWPAIAPLRPFTVFYYYQPQEMILVADWPADPLVWLRLGVLVAVGTVGYLLALWAFCRRDLPAPL